MKSTLRVAVASAVVLTSCGGSTEQSATATALETREDGAMRSFVTLSAAASGITTGNELRAENVLPYVYDGAGVASGDLDGDGRPDVYIVSQDGKNRLYRQHDTLRFEDVTDAAGVDGGDAWGTGCSIVDVDGDGLLDIYVCNLESPNLLYRNLGGMRFEECAARFGLDFVGASFFAAFADYDGDDDLDVYLLTNRVFLQSLLPELLARATLPGAMQKSLRELAPPMPDLGADVGAGKSRVPAGYEDHLIEFEGRVFFGGQPDRLLRNDGERFVDVTTAANIADHGMGLSATWWDFDDDGHLDLYVANDLESPDLLYRNLGDGRFEEVAAQRLPHVAYFGMGSDAGDVNGDGRLDLIVADMAMRSHYDAKMLMGDMGDRGWFLENGRPPQVMRNALFLNTGTERFLECGLLAGVAKTDWTWTVKFADLDCDGHLDLFATNGIPRFDNDPDAKLRFRELWDDGRRAEAIELASKLSPVPEPNLALRNEGCDPGDIPHFVDVSREWGLDLVGVSQGASVVDLDRDGDLDLLVGNQNAPALIHENRVGKEMRALLLRLVGPGRNTHAIGARVTAWIGNRRIDRHLTGGGGYLSTHEPIVHIGLGAHDRVDRLVVRWPGRHGVSEHAGLRAGVLHTLSCPERALAAPPAADPKVATERPWFAAAASLTPPHRHQETKFDDYAAQPLVPHRHSQLGPGLAFGDVDGDGQDDLFVGGARGQGGRLYLHRAAGFLERAGPWQADGPHEDLGAVFFDLDADGDLDLFVVSGSNEVRAGDPSLRDRLYVNRGDGTFEARQDALPAFADSGSVVCAADYDRDGDLDLFVGGRVVPGRYPLPALCRLYENRKGRLVDVLDQAIQALRPGGLITSAVFTDLDDDGWQDLLVAGHWQPLRWFRNRGDGTFEERTDTAGFGERNGWWNGLAVGDIDGDGDLDVVATNLGRNTKYKASRAKPARLFAADVDDSGSLDVIEAKFEGDRLLPVRGRSCSSRAIPVLGERFPTYDQFARAGLEDIYGAEALSESTQLSADEVAHVLWRNEGDGRFAPSELPVAAQVAPGFGVSITDFDGDGHADLAIAHNFFTPEPETGRMAGGLGLLLAGSEQGLRALQPLESGLLAPGDTKALGVADLDGNGSPDLLLSENDGPLRAFANRSDPSRFLNIRLRGEAGNPAAIGARLLLRRTDGSQTVAEIRSGCSYLTTSPTSVWFGLGAAKSARLWVRWPDGSESEHAVDGPGARTLTR
jgi:hypothetical protein